MLRKEITILGGLSVSLWQIQGIMLNQEKKEVILTLYPIIGEAPLAAGKKMFRVTDVIYEPPYEKRTSRHYSEYFAPAALEGKDVYTVAYEYIKTHIPEFEGAEDA